MAMRQGGRTIATGTHDELLVVHAGTLPERDVDGGEVVLRGLPNPAPMGLLLPAKWTGDGRPTATT
ncbi:hypothetical protein ACFY3V_33115 [Streptosporangium sp. NPDC000095]|uniref:hypothetical protein n=1 Tax=Streptosporangium sp. NPDC000095 TaxID=3366184 RepID=UPI003683BC76